MKFSAVASSLLLSSAALAAPLAENTLTRRNGFSETAHLRTHLNQRVETAGNLKAATGENITASTAASAVTYSSNWGGAVLIGSGYTEVTGTFVVPNISTPSGGSADSSYCAAAWVGIDGDTCSSAILQTGINICIEDGKITNTAFYEWYPASQEYWSDITINTGDTITATVSASSTSSGTATITNRSNGQTVSYTFSGEGNELCETNAEWIMEDLSSGGGLTSFANFGSDFTFTDAYAISNGQLVDTTGATIFDIEQEGEVLTSASASGGTVTVSYA